MLPKEKVLEQYNFEIYETDPYFYRNYKQKIKVDKNGHEYMRFRIDFCFSEYNLVVEVDEKGHTESDLIFEEKRQEAVEKKLNCKFIRTNPNK